MSFSTWLFVRLIVPTGPILIQLILYLLGAYTPPFPQITFIVMVFGLSLATVTERKDENLLIYLSIIPAVVATVLYTTAILMQVDKPETYMRTLVVGFIFWLVMIIINIVYVLIDLRRRFNGARNE